MIEIRLYQTTVGTGTLTGTTGEDFTFTLDQPIKLFKFGADRADWFLTEAEAWHDQSEVRTYEVMTPEDLRRVHGYLHTAATDQVLTPDQRVWIDDAVVAYHSSRDGGLKGTRGLRVGATLKNAAQLERLRVAGPIYLA